MKAATTTPIPSSWDLDTWPVHVWPSSADRARSLLRARKVELHKAGALARIGRKLVFIGAGYERWLASQEKKVFDFDVPMNRPEHAHKRFGGRDA